MKALHVALCIEAASARRSKQPSSGGVVRTARTTVHVSAGDRRTRGNRHHGQRVVLKEGGDISR